MSLYENCMLEGDALNARVANLLGYPLANFCSDWHDGGPLIETNQIFLDPPHEAHVNYGPGSDGVCRGAWIKENRWTATVSAAVRTKPNPNDPQLPRVVGRGSGPTALIAAMRAIVDSFPEGDARK